MNIDSFTYRPHRSYTYFAIACLLLAILSVVMIVCSLHSPGKYIVYLVLYLLVNIAFTKYFFDMSKIILRFDSDSIQFQNKKGTRTISWKCIKYACEITNIKGYRFVLLSCDSLNQEKARKYANRGSLSTKMCINNTFIIPIDPLQNTDQLEELVHKKTGDGSLS